MKRFVFVIESLSVASGGPARVAAAVSAGLADRGHNVSITCLAEDKSQVEISSKVRVLSLGKKKFGPLTWLQAAMRLKKYCAAADVIIVSGIWGPIDGLALRLAKLDHSRLYIRTCGMLEEYILRRNPWKKWLARKIYTNHNLSYAKELLVNTDIEKKKLINLGFNTPINVIPNGVHIPLLEDQIERSQALKILEWQLNEHDKVLLYLGRIHPKKGLHLLLSAFAAFRVSRPEWKLLVAGSFSDHAFQSEIKALSLEVGEHGVFFVGEVQGASKSACFSIADCFALPSLSEGFPNAVVEALSWGIPALVTPGCNFPFVEEYQAGVEVNAEVNALLEGLRLILKENTLEEMGKNARSLIKDRYQLTQVITQFEMLAINASS